MNYEKTGLQKNNEWVQDETKTEIHFFYQTTFLEESEAEKCPKCKNMLRTNRDWGKAKNVCFECCTKSWKYFVIAVMFSSSLPQFLSCLLYLPLYFELSAVLPSSGEEGRNAESSKYRGRYRRQDRNCGKKDGNSNNSNHNGPDKEDCEIFCYWLMFVSATEPSVMYVQLCFYIFHIYCYIAFSLPSKEAPN